MPIFVSPEKPAYLHVDPGGHCMTLPADDPQEVPELFTKAAIASGCVLLDPGAKFRKPEPVDPAGEDREQLITDAIQEMVMKGRPDDFNGKTGLPKVPAVSEAVGFKVTVNEIADIWNELGAETPAAED